MMKKMLPAVLGALTLCSCVLSPRDDQQVTSTSQTVSMNGYTITAGDTISIRAATSPSGPYVEIATTVASNSPITLVDGQSYYAFSVSFTVPSQYWTGDACLGQETFLRARSVGLGIDLRTYEQLAADGQSVPDCFTDYLDSSGSSLAAILYCDSPDSPNLRLHTAGAGAPFGHVGDVTIANAADLDAWVCLENLTGDLTVPDSTLDDIVLPVLGSVTGDVTLTYTRPGLGYFESTRTMSFPMLTNIGGTLTIDSPAPIASQVINLDAGLDALNTLGGDLIVDVDTFNCDLDGLGTLGHIPGNLELVTGNGDTSLFGFLTGLVSIGGDALVDIGHSSYAVLPSVVSIGGDLEHIDGNFVAPGFGSAGYLALETIGGDFTLAFTDPNGPPTSQVFDALTSVGGTMTYEDVGPGGRDALYVGDTLLEVHGLVVTDNAALAAMGGANLSVLGSGPITITNNANLCTSSVNSFVAAQGGWTGVLTASGNDDGC